MPIVKIQPNGYHFGADSGTVQQFPASGDKWAKLADSDDNTYAYVFSPNVVSPTWDLTFTSYTLAVNERCAGVRTEVRKSQYGGNSYIITRIADDTHGALPLATEQSTNYMIAESKVSSWQYTELTQANIDYLYAYIDLVATGGNVLLLKLDLALDIRIKPDPTLTNIAAQTGVDPASTKAQWSLNSGTQKKYQVKVFTPAVAEAGGFDPETDTTVADSGVVTSSTTSHTFTNLAHGTEYYIYVKVAVDFNGADWWSEWSSSGWNFTTNYKPVINITAPAGTITDASRPPVVWTYTDTDGEVQNSYQVKIFKEPTAGWGGFDPETNTADLIWDSGVVTSAVVTATPPDSIPNNLAYRAYGKARQYGIFSGSPATWSDWDYSDFVMDLTQPAEPSFAISPVNSNQDRVDLVITPPLSSPTVIAYYVVKRSFDGENFEAFRVYDHDHVEQDSDNLVSVDPIYLVDYEIPLHKVVYYQVESVSITSGTPIASTPTILSTVLKHNRVWWKNPQDPTQNWSFPVEDSWLQRKYRKPRLTLEPLGRRKPVVLRESAQHSAFSISILLFGDEDLEKFEALANEACTYYVQTPKGAWYAEISEDIQMSDHLWDELRDEVAVRRATISFQEVGII